MKNKRRKNKGLPGKSVCTAAYTEVKGYSCFKVMSRLLCNGCIEKYLKGIRLHLKAQPLG